jgi:hypothetical protein
MDRTDAPAAKGIGGAVSARTPMRRRGGSVPRGPAGGEGEGRGVADASARRAAGFGAARGAGFGDLAGACSGGLVPPPRAGGGRAPARCRGCPRGPELQLAPDPRPAHALGELLNKRSDELQLEAAPRSGGDPGLRGRARGCPPGRAGPLTPLLEAAWLAQRGVARARGVAPAAWARAEALGPRTCAGVRRTTGIEGRLGRVWQRSVPDSGIKRCHTPRGPTPQCRRSLRPGYSQRKKRTAKNRPAAAQAATTSAAVAASPPPPTMASDSPSIRCFSGSASAIALSASGRSSAE